MNSATCTPGRSENATSLMARRTIGEYVTLELDPDGHVDCAYVNLKYRRSGIMTTLVEHAVDTCLASGVNRLFVEASIGARPLFEKAGFRLLGENHVTIKGVKLLNYKMELTVSNAGV